jgi:hypothetical protein
VLGIARAVLALVALAACGDSGEGAAEDAGASFIALASDFEGFQGWPFVELGALDGTRGHDMGVSRVHLRGIVPAVDVQFAVGTMIVKVTEIGAAPPEWEVHAMVKRGGGYNGDGAPGWEWFDLALTADGAPVIAWRGEGSASDPGSYGGLDTDAGPDAQTCNGCHGAVVNDDYVFTHAELGRLD